jgi:hypothetical protein
LVASSLVIFGGAILILPHAMTLCVGDSQVNATLGTAALTSPAEKLYSTINIPGHPGARAIHNAQVIAAPRVALFTGLLIDCSSFGVLTFLR